jgi:tyrosyl-tRNA synthetase
MANVLEVLKERGFIEAITHDQLKDHLSKPAKVYCGFDPTSDSLHLGNMVAIMGLAWYQKFGHTPYVILGGATGMIGDPSGKSKERQLLDEDSLEKNVKGIRRNFDGILDFQHPEAAPVVLNNLDWFKDFSLIPFLRDVGKYFRVGAMLSKESVRTRLESEEGMSFTEFSYQLLQGYDFLHLNTEYDVSVQIGGSDQWGNITAGIDLVRRVGSKQAYGMTMPLLTTSDGKKFGKSEEGAIWLSSEKLSPYQFYQYLVRVQDADVIRLMKMLTFMDMDEIRDFEQQMNSPEYVPHTAQKRLAKEVTRIVHGEEGLEVALKVTDAAKPGSETALNADILESISRDMPSQIFMREEVLELPMTELLVKAALQDSKGQARRLINSGGFYLNNEKVTDEKRTLAPGDLIGGRMVLLAVGKKNKKLIRLEEAEK